MVEEVCPLCGEDVLFYDINFNEAVLMCSNKVCLYPFEDCELQFQETSASKIDLSFIDNSKACENDLEDTDCDMVPQDFFTKINSDRKRKSSKETTSPIKKLITEDDAVMIKQMNSIYKLVKTPDEPTVSRPVVTNPELLHNLKILAERKEKKSHTYSNSSNSASNFNIEVIKSEQNLDCIININLTEDMLKK